MKAQLAVYYIRHGRIVAFPCKQPLMVYPGFLKYADRAQRQGWKPVQWKSRLADVIDSKRSQCGRRGEGGFAEARTWTGRGVDRERVLWHGCGSFDSRNRDRTAGGGAKKNSPGHSWFHNGFMTPYPSGR